MSLRQAEVVLRILAGVLPMSTGEGSPTKGRN